MVSLSKQDKTTKKMAAGDIFKKLTGQSAFSFQTTEEVDTFMERETGKKFDIQLKHEAISSCRGSVHPFKSYNPDKEIENALGNPR